MEGWGVGISSASGSLSRDISVASRNFSRSSSLLFSSNILLGSSGFGQEAFSGKAHCALRGKVLELWDECIANTFA